MYSIHSVLIHTRKKSILLMLFIHPNIALLKSFKNVIELAESVFGKLEILSLSWMISTG